MANCNTRTGLCNCLLNANVLDSFLCPMDFFPPNCTYSERVYCYVLLCIDFPCTLHRLPVSQVPDCLFPLIMSVFLCCCTIFLSLCSLSSWLADRHSLFLFLIDLPHLHLLPLSPTAHYSILGEPPYHDQYLTYQEEKPNFLVHYEYLPLLFDPL